MDTADTKQIIIAYYATKDSCDAILKPISINLNDTETAMKMSREQKGGFEHIQMECEAIQEVVEKLESHIVELEGSIHNDGEIDAARKMISDILFDIPPIPNKSNYHTNMIDLAHGAAGIERL